MKRRYFDKYSLLDTQEVTDSSSVEPTTFQGLTAGKSSPPAAFDRPLVCPTLCEAAGIRLRHQPTSEANFAALLPVIKALMEMRRAGLLSAIWVDNFRLRLQYPGSKERSNVSWNTAERLASAFLQRKSVQAEQKSGSASADICTLKGLLSWSEAVVEVADK